MDNQFKLIIGLRQYTPLIHFQGDTKEACLRASEVKPKLDRFVLEYLERQGERVPEQWVLKVSDDEKSNHHPALRYKMRFEGEPKKVDAHPLYFAANMGGQAVAVEYKKPVQMTVVSLVPEHLGRTLPLYQGELDNPTLLEVVNALLPAFFALHCFGTRSGKGFGSFEVMNNRNLSDAELDYYKEKQCQKLYRLTSKKRLYSPNQCLDDIFLLSGMMKGGFNRPYFKGEVQKALWSQNLGSEKAFMKQKIFPHESIDRSGTTLLEWYQDEVCRGNDRSRERYPDYRFVRAMLGLPDHYDFGVGKKGKTISVTAQREEIARFANPVRFKPCQGGFRVLVYEVPDTLLKTTFDLAFRDKKYELKLPDANEFSLIDFLNDFFSPIYDTRARRAHGWDKLKGKTFMYFPSRVVIQFDDTLEMLRLDYGKEG